jgi:hypothetical protein
MAAVAAALPGQAPRLLDGVEAPLAYLCLEATPPGDEAAKPVAGTVQRLLADPSFDVLFGNAAAASDASRDSAPNPASNALALVRGLLARSTGGLEIVLTGVLPNAGQPLLLLRARLQRPEAERLQTVLASGELAAPERSIGAQQTYRLLDGRPVDGRRSDPVATPGPGQRIELALVGTDLLVGNDGAAMQELLAPVAPVTSASPTRTVLSADPSFRALKPQLPVSPGSLWVYTDWRRLGARIQADLGGVTGALVGSSGLGQARSVMASVSSAQSGLAATLLLEFDGQLGGEVGGEVADGDRRTGVRNGPADAIGVDGWLAAVRPIAARSLLGELPVGGLGGLVLSVDLAAIAQSSHEGQHLLHDLEQAFDSYGLDFRRNVVDRLGERGTVQLQISGDAVGARQIASVYSLRAKNRKAAGDLFADLRRVCEAEQLGRMVALKDAKDQARRAIEVLQIDSRRHGPAVGVAVIDDAVLVGPDVETLVGFVDELRRAPKARAKRDPAVAAAVQTIGGESIAGLFDVDLQPWFELVAAAFAGSGTKPDLSALPRRHFGHLDVQREGDKSVVRVRVLSSRGA